MAEETDIQKLDSEAVDQQQACSPFPWESIPDWMFGKSVEARNALQNCGRVHPYTCGNNDCRKATNQAPLRAVEDGWVCDHCGYTQSNTANTDYADQISR